MVIEFHLSSAHFLYLSCESGLLNYPLSQKVVIASHFMSEGMCSFPNVSDKEMSSHQKDSSRDELQRNRTTRVPSPTS